jgi:hypothetical protein
MLTLALGALAGALACGVFIWLVVRRIGLRTQQVLGDALEPKEDT